jgi:predicted pyridoxine 5'-phosphate oxidase superfamily flavin-nucleotide-binding protein
VIPTEAEIMSRLYDAPHRALQESQGTRALADRIELVACKTEFGDEEKGYIDSREMFFLTTIDARGRPTVSYKGGAPGFVRVVDPVTLVFPSYDGNGMYLSMGNLSVNPQVGLLFIAFDRPHRLRMQGTASLSAADALMAEYPEAEFIVRVRLTEFWVNCPRYIHRFEKQQTSRYVPQPGCTTPLAEWKRVDRMQDVLSRQDAQRAQQQGLISEEEWIAKVKAGDPTA